MTRLDEIRERERKATKGPWLEKCGVLKHYIYDNACPEHVECDIHIALQELDCLDGHEVPAHDNATFIAASRSDIPYLLSLVDEARELIKEGVEPDAGWDSLEPALNWLQRVSE